MRISRKKLYIDSFWKRIYNVNNKSLNGGGHFSSAATQMEEVSIEEAKKMLYSKLESFVGDTRIE